MPRSEYPDAAHGEEIIRKKSGLNEENCLRRLTTQKLLMNAENRLRIAAVTAAILAGVNLIPAHAHAWKTGSAAPGFRVQDMHGHAVDLENFRGKVTLLNFWTPWCASCLTELPALGRLHKEYQKDGLEVIGIALGTDSEGLKEFLRKFPLAFKLLPDKKETVGNLYRISGLPTTVIISKKGIIIHRHTGFDRGMASLYEKEITELLKE